MKRNIIKTKYVLTMIIILIIAMLLHNKAAFSDSGKQGFYAVSPVPAPISSLKLIPSLVPEPTPEPDPEPTQRVWAVPVRLIYPSIGIDAEIGPVGVEEDNSMGVIPSLSVVSWFERSACPGQAGNMILAAHRRWQGSDGPFANLASSNRGDSVTIVDETQASWQYTVQSVELVEYANPPSYVMDTGGEERVTLITCIGNFSKKYGTAEQRVVVVLKPAEALEP